MFQAQIAKKIRTFSSGSASAKKLDVLIKKKECHEDSDSVFFSKNFETTYTTLYIFNFELGVCGLELKALQTRRSHSRSFALRIKGTPQLPFNQSKLKHLRYIREKQF